MNVRQIEIFEALMRTGSVSAAARALNLSQPAVTKSLRLAEQSAGFTLFRRVRGRLFPSREAESLLPGVKKVREDLEAVAQRIHQLKHGSAGTVTIASVASLTHALLTPVVARFARERPDIRIEVTSLPSRMVVETVANSQADLGLIHDPSDNLYVDGDDLCQAEVVCVVPRKHALARRRSLGAADLQQESLITFRADTPLGAAVRRALSDANVTPDIHIVVNQSQHAINLVEAGAGVALIDPFLMIHGGHSTVVPITLRPGIPLRPRIIRARDRPHSRAALQFSRETRAVVAELARTSPFLVRAGQR